jgi:uncharacterized protein YkvS
MATKNWNDLSLPEKVIVNGKRSVELMRELYQLICSEMSYV